MAKPVAALDYLARPDKHPVAPVCVLFGDEAFLKRQALAELRRQVLGGEGDGDLSYSSYSGEKADKLELKTVFDGLSTVSMFGGVRRLVVVTDADPFVTAHRAKLEDYHAKPRSTGVLVLSVETWPATTKLYKALEKTGLPIDCKALKADAVAAWIPRWAKSQYDVELAAPAVQRVMEHVGTEMGLLDQELAKVSLLAGADKKVTVQLVDEVIGGRWVKDKWNMIDAAAAGEARSALLMLDRLILTGEAPIAMLGMLNATLKRVASATKAIEQSERERTGLKLGDAARKYAPWPGAAAKIEEQLRQIGRARARQLHRWLLEADLAMKGASSAPAKARMVLEKFIGRLAKELGETPARPPVRPR